VVVLGSAPLLIQRGLTESLAGRFEVLRLPHWSYAEMREAFAFSLDEYLFFGGYPGAAPLIGEPGRWRRYVVDALIETTIPHCATSTASCCPCWIHRPTRRVGTSDFTRAQACRKKGDEQCEHPRRPPQRASVLA